MCQEILDRQLLENVFRPSFLQWSKIMNRPPSHNKRRYHIWGKIGFHKPLAVTQFQSHVWVAVFNKERANLHNQQQQENIQSSRNKRKNTHCSYIFANYINLSAQKKEKSMLTRTLLSRRKVQECVSSSTYSAVHLLSPRFC